MTCVYKEYKVKNVTGAMTTAKKKSFIGLQHENCYLVGKGRNKNLMGGGIFPHFWQVGEDILLDSK